jgi:hypothetical protein
MSYCLNHYNSRREERDLRQAPTSAREKAKGDNLKAVTEELRVP